MEPEHPTTQAMLAALHGEGAGSGAVAVHCRACDRCRPVWEDLAAARAALDAELPPPDPAPMWPHVRARLARSRPRRLTAPWAAGTAAALAGLLLGIWLGTSDLAAPSEQSQDIWSTLGSTLSSTSALSDFYTTGTQTEGSGS
jgi:hypothetical protein